MANVTLAVTSERYGTTTLQATQLNIVSSTDLTDNYSLPVGFGDCLILSVAFYWAAIQTAVANPELRGPAYFILSNNVRDFLSPGANARWRRYSNTINSLISEVECFRPVAWYQTEVMNVQAQAEDTGAGNSSDLGFAVRVMRLRNQIDSGNPIVFRPDNRLSPTR